MTSRAFAALHSNIRSLVCAVAALATLAGSASAGSPTAITLTLKNHRFTPSVLVIPAGEKVRVTLVNQDPATEEFDSRDLRLEKAVTPMGRVSFDIGPLQAGQYRFTGEFHTATAQGEVTVLPGAP